MGKVAREFSLDNEDGALSRLVTRVERAQETITQEFSLDHDGSALQRLSSMLEKTGVAVATSLTLDDEASPLARLKREILEVLEQHKTANTNFQTDVRSTLDAFKVRREEAARSTTHGHTFEACVGDFLLNEAQRHGDLQEAVGTTMGQAARKTGDHVLTLGPDSGAPDARIVCESKAKKDYTEKSALAEIALGRKKRLDPHRGEVDDEGEASSHLRCGRADPRAPRCRPLCPSHRADAPEPRLPPSGPVQPVRQGGRERRGRRVSPASAS